MKYIIILCAVVPLAMAITGENNSEDSNSIKLWSEETQSWINDFVDTFRRTITFLDTSIRASLDRVHDVYYTSKYEEVKQKYLALAKEYEHSTEDKCIQYIRGILRANEKYHKQLSDHLNNTSQSWVKSVNDFHSLNTTGNKLAEMIVSGDICGSEIKINGVKTVVDCTNKQEMAVYESTVAKEILKNVKGFMAYVTYWETLFHNFYTNNSFQAFYFGKTDAELRKFCHKKS
ncbi:uncharacterized protein [Fopius arisanus]|uniref:4 protein n=1 Tax=Fopius arisanus TaxID=64838 RepID=A0A0C9RL20_9HYME|nr:PREDICTED: uncharacterized protein LOC105264780 [Fopius arisanus]